MEPIPVFYDNVRRSALVIKPRKPFIDWLSKIDPEDENIDLSKDTDVYLLPDFEDIEQIEKWLKKNFDEIFCDQMNHWYIDESMWVEKRTFKMFKEWFDYSLHSMIWDTQEGSIKKD
jgi:hypothetical protein